MAKTKKKAAAKRNDARGYGQVQKPQQQLTPKVATQGPPPAQHKPAEKTDATLESIPSQPNNATITASVQDRLETLIRDFQGLSLARETLEHADPIPSMPSDRFAKRLAGIYDKLVALDFDYQNAIQPVVAALGYDITLEDALDWLCIHLSTADLPPLFTEGNVREYEKNAGSSTETPSVIVAVPSTKPKSDATDDAANCEYDAGTKQSDTSFVQIPEKQIASSNAAPEQEEEDNKKAKHEVVNKDWLLKMYQYEEADDDEEGNEHDQQDSQHHSASVPTNSNATEEPTSTVAAQPPNEQQQRLILLEKEYQDAKADLADEASNYMRSKHEITMLQKRVKALGQQVAGLQRKIAKQQQQEEQQRAAEEAPAPANDDEGEEQEDEDEGAVDIFSSMIGAAPAINEADASKAETPAAEPPTMRVDIPDDAIPKNWTGKTPKTILEDYCRKQKMSRPSFQKLPLEGCLVCIKLPTSKHKPLLQVEHPGPVRRYADAQQYASTKALYELSPDLPLYRLFPPFYRDVWRSWVDQVEQQASEEDRARDLERQSRIDKLVALIPDPVPMKSNVEAIEKTEVDVEIAAPVEAEVDNWDDESEDAGPKHVDKVEDKESQRLKKRFLDRRASSAYQRMLEQRSALPIYAYRQEIIDAVAKNPVTVLHAETGAGKTTQCASFLLEQALLEANGANTSILISQPRRIAATSVAERVSEELGEKTIGKLVGYQIRLESKKSSETRLLFCTTGVILRRIIDDPTLSGVSHVIVDEVHERQLQIDVLLITLRSLLNGARPDLKVLLMSATLDAKLFCSFFHDAPLVSVPGRTFPVSNYYLEDLFDATNHIIEEDSPFALRDRRRSETATLWVTKQGGDKRREIVPLESETQADVSEDYVGYSMSTRKSMDRVNESVINYDLIEDTLKNLLTDDVQDRTLLPPDGFELNSGAVLIFLPGIGEIRTLTDRLRSNRIFGDERRFDIIPMHSALSSRDQRRAFVVPRKVQWAIVVSTNIAETSVTIPDAVCVIDSGRAREVRHDKRTSTRRLVTDWCSRASAKQRSGRAGRVQPGMCLKLYSSNTHKAMKVTTEPEIKRLPLEEVCLTILAGGISSNCADFLSQAPQPPPADAVRVALNVLAEVGAISFGTDSIESLTPLGRNLANLPVDCRLGKMLIYGVIFRCIDDIVTIVAGLSATASPFASFLYEHAEAKAKKAAFLHADSDFLTIVNVYEAYHKANGLGKARQFCRENYLNYSALREIHDGREQYLGLLSGIGFMEYSRRGNQSAAKPYPRIRVNEHAIHAVICAGLYPNIVRIEQSPGGEDSVWSKKDRVFIHSSSSNGKLPRYLTSKWIAFFEKFGNEKRTMVSSTCFVHPFALLLFGGRVEVHHTERKVVVDDWMELPLAAKPGVLFTRLRSCLDQFLEAAIKSTNGSLLDRPETTAVLDEVVEIFA